MAPGRRSASPVMRAARRTFMVTIPPETESGTRIRLAGLGRKEGERSGDIYLKILVEG